jgi:RNA polymerase sigma-70 factor (ECF subfamily)
MPGHDAQETFEALRPRLFGLGYRMLGVRADAEDVIQEAWLRWLVTVTTRLAVDRLRAARVEREAYVGSWLPEPLVELDERSPEATLEQAHDLSLAFLLLLERLAPEERAAFLLRQVFDYDYPEIAAILGKTEAAVRQAVHRARERVRAGRPRFRVSAETHLRLLEKFVTAARSGDRAAIRALLDENAQAIGDGGGKVPSVPGGMHGAERVTNLYWAQARRYGPRLDYRIATINGEPGLLRFIDGRLESAQAVVTDGSRIVAFYVVRNPDKLARVLAPDAAPAGRRVVQRGT